MHVSFGTYPFSPRSDKPRKMRVMVYIDQWGQTQYEPQAKYYFRWLPNNGGTTRRPRSLAWSLIHGMKLKLDQIEFVEIGRAKANMKALREQEYRLSFFPFDPPKKERK